MHGLISNFRYVYNVFDNYLALLHTPLIHFNLLFKAVYWQYYFDYYLISSISPIYELK